MYDPGILQITDTMLQFAVPDIVQHMDNMPHLIIGLCERRLIHEYSLGETILETGMPSPVKLMHDRSVLDQKDTTVEILRLLINRPS